MRIEIGVEENNEGRSLAWALDYPGCFAYGENGSEAIVSLARELAIYQEWVNRYGGPGWLELGDYDLRLVETWEVYTINDAYDLQDGGYAVNAWFRKDWKPLTSDEVEKGLSLLRWSRQDFLEVLAPITEEQLERKYPGERWSISGIVRHVANAEWWYLDRLGLAEAGREALPRQTFERLAWTREQLEITLSSLVGRELVAGKEGEFWSPRKLLRRALWHEIDHRRHIQRLCESI